MPTWVVCRSEDDTKHARCVQTVTYWSFDLHLCPANLHGHFSFMAPSVRVKRSEYSNLGEPSRRDTHPLTSIFIPPNAQNAENPTPQLRVDSPTPQTERNVATLPSRQRSSTFGSIVHRHCRRSRSLATSRLLDQDGQESIASTSHGTPSQGGSAASYASRPRYLSVQGEQDADLPARGAPYMGRRRAGTVLSITTSNRESSLLPDDDETHHHDDIVEHLDVIGMFHFPYHWTHIYPSIPCIKIHK